MPGKRLPLEPPFGTLQQHQMIFDLVAEHTATQNKYHEFYNLISSHDDAAGIAYRAQEEMFKLENKIIDALLSDPDLYELVIHYSDALNGDFPRERAELLLAMHQRGVEKRRRKNPQTSALGAVAVAGIAGFMLGKSK